uniref:Uncharacterized protein n=1 Tax=Oryza meridionalis TaxID=40149 RepID=A0A0E0E0L0_9ORYZ
MRYVRVSCRHGYAGEPGISTNLTGLSSSLSSAGRGITRNREWSMANTTCGTPSSAASGCVHPQRKSDSTVTTRSGVPALSRAHDPSGPRSPANATTRVGKSLGAAPGGPFGTSRPAGTAWWEGNGRVSSETPPPPGCAAARSGAVAGVATTVRRRPREARRRTRSRMGMRWPSAGYGTTRTCAAAAAAAAASVGVAMVAC